MLSAQIETYRGTVNYEINCLYYNLGSNTSSNIQKHSSTNVLLGLCGGRGKVWEASRLPGYQCI